jgi:ElaB/YqjD/DUF883 family membrane-anchored ribosome-binding protein
MSEDRMEGAARVGLGRVQDAVGGLVGNGATQAKGKLNEAVGTAQNVYGKVTDRAHDAFDQAGDRVKDACGDVESYVQDQPLQALAIGVGIGLAIGLLLSGSRKIALSRG